MNWVRRVLNYLARLEWTELKQHVCSFCDRKNFEEIVYDDDEIIAIKNRTAAGKHHWLLMPISPPFRHIRDIEALEAADIPLLREGKTASAVETLRRCSSHRYPLRISSWPTGFNRWRTLPRYCLRPSHPSTYHSKAATTSQSFQIPAVAASDVEIRQDGHGGTSKEERATALSSGTAACKSRAGRACRSCISTLQPRK
ncbi:hypothetical protein FB567DRAFT_48493 [Paraphoma chrysanthemicola]|uniref:HIT domain-containing protein n=1 Tax=Paraphoma chrysanthemicola TaxID=798071 RepID=A0A8K0RMI4_9PLEO|nr:hypothetical protein FB567DRAFT_48493 [Paraphoma chrysanthemicola]